MGEEQRKTGKMKIDSLVVGMVQTNCYIISNTATGEALVIDPGAEEGKILDYLKENNLSLQAILLTHGHFDHIMAVNEVKDATRAKVIACEEEKRLLEDAALNCSKDIRRPYEVMADQYLKDGSEFSEAGFSIKLIHTPGHTSGGACFLVSTKEGQQALFCGDTLFFESAGRTDLPTGNQDQLMASLKERILILPEDLLVYPGHGMKTSIAYEKANNPYAGEGRFFW